MSRQSRMTDTIDEHREEMQDAQASEFTAATRTVTISSGLSIGGYRRRRRPSKPGRHQQKRIKPQLFNATIDESAFTVYTYSQ